VRACVCVCLFVFVYTYVCTCVCEIARVHACMYSRLFVCVRAFYYLILMTSLVFYQHHDVAHLSQDHNMFRFCGSDVLTVFVRVHDRERDIRVCQSFQFVRDLVVQVRQVQQLEARYRGLPVEHHVHGPVSGTVHKVGLVDVYVLRVIYEYNKCIYVYSKLWRCSIAGSQRAMV